MSQSKTPCPVCARPPGVEHRDNCPRSRMSRRLMDSILEHVSRPHICWAFGTFTVRKGKTSFEVTNPGLPYVRPPMTRQFNRGRTKDVLGLLWFAGGVPKDEREGCRQFIKQLGGLT